VPGRRYYRSRFFLTGVALLALGVGNALIGSRKLVQYQAVVAEGRERGYFPSDETTNQILRPLDDEGERYNIGRARVDLYHVVLSGGLLMIALGAILTIVAWVRIRLRGRHDSAGLGQPPPLPSAEKAHQPLDAA